MRDRNVPGCLNLFWTLYDWTVNGQYESLKGAMLILWRRAQRKGRVDSSCGRRLM